MRSTSPSMRPPRRRGPRSPRPVPSSKGRLTRPSPSSSGGQSSPPSTRVAKPSPAHCSCKAPGGSQNGAAAWDTGPPLDLHPRRRLALTSRHPLAAREVVLGVGGHPVPTVAAGHDVLCRWTVDDLDEVVAASGDEGVPRLLVPWSDVVVGRDRPRHRGCPWI